MERISGFDWDEANQRKCISHGVSIEEIESLFKRSVMVRRDTAHSGTEERIHAVGRTNEGRYVFIVFTLREQPSGESLVRPISARYMHDKEIQRYEKETQEASDV